MKKTIVTLLLFGIVGSAALYAEETKEVVEVEKDYTPAKAKKQTKLGLYLPAGKAYDKWKANPEEVTILDVRTPEEYIFVGHPEMAWNVPLKIATYETVEGHPELVMKLTPDFVDRVKTIVEPTDTIFVTCRSGGRGAEAVNLLADAGFENVYNIIDGFEGDTVKDEDSAYYGKRRKNGWKNSGRPWTYEVDPAKMLLPGLLQKPGEKPSEKPSE